MKGITIITIIFITIFTYKNRSESLYSDVLSF